MLTTQAKKTENPPVMQVFMHKHAKNSICGYINRYTGTLDASLCKKRFSTGFPNIDAALTGGITPGIIVLGAESGAGKSTLSLQIATQMAADGQPVLYFSREMTADDLAAKIVSRYTYVNDGSASCSFSWSSSDLRNADVLLSLEPEEQEAIHAAAAAAKAVGDKLTIIEGLDTKTVGAIAEYVYWYIRCTDQKPVVIVDYLQILAPDMKTLNDKQAMDYNMDAMKQLADHYSIPVIVISSLNRESYDGDLTMRAFKGSGNIEYTADVALGLQISQTSKKTKDSDEDPIRNVDLVILKQRYGPCGDKIPLEFHPRFSYFNDLSSFSRCSCNLPDEFEDSEELK